MTGPEKLDFKDLRDEMREGFRTVEAAVEKVANRVHSLELTRAEQTGEGRQKKRIDDERRWRIGLACGIAGSLAVGLINIFIAH